MKLPDFFENVRRITLHDPLAELLGAAQDGMVTYSYADAVKLCGHSCPTVAGAYLMTLAGLARLYGRDTPQRGGIKVEFRNEQDSGVTGVMANVAGLITGAAGDSGFKGLGGLHDRRNLLFFGCDVDGTVRFERLDTQAAVTLEYHPEIVPADPGVMHLLPGILTGGAGDDDKKAFAQGWQDRVRRILEQIDNPALVTCA
jgi:hypothetical protein